MRSLLLAGLLLPGIACAKGFPDEAAVVQYALAHNRELSAARLAISEAEARSRRSGKLSNPELEVVVAGGRDFEGRIELGLYQRFPLSARLRLEREISLLELEAARCEVAVQEQAIAARVRKAVLALAQARESRLLRARQADLSRTFAESFGKRVEEGFASPLDATQATLEARQLQTSMAELRADEYSAAGELAVLLGLPVSETPHLEGTLRLPSAVPPARSPVRRPDLRLAEIAVEAAQKDLGLARAMRWDDVGAGIFVEGERFRDEPEGIENEALLGMKLSLPLPIWQNGEAAVAEKTLLAQRRTDLLEALHYSARQQADATWKNMQARLAVARQVRDDVLPLARKLLQDTQSAYGRGEADVQRLFRAREHLIEVEASALHSLIQYHLARAEWLAAVGEP